LLNEQIAISASGSGYHTEDSRLCNCKRIVTSNIYGTIKARCLFDAIRISQRFWCSTMQNYQKFSTQSLLF